MTGEPDDTRADARLARGKAIAAGLLALTLFLRIYTVSGEVAAPGAMLNDMVFHDAAIRAASEKIGRFEDPLDAWVGSISVGYPLLRQYQPAAHVAAAALHRALGGRASVARVRAALVALALAAFPFAVYRAARDLGLDRIAAAGAAAASPLLEAPLLLGLTDQAYLWRGFGLFTQAPGAALFVIAIGKGALALRRGRGWLLAGALVGGALITHFIFGWLAALVIAALALLPLPAVPLRERALRLAKIGAVAAAASAFILVPAVRTSAWANQSAIEPAEKWIGYPAGTLAAWALSGRLLDGDVDAEGGGATRYPVISILAAAGLGLAIAAAVRRRERPAARILAILAVSALLLTVRAHWDGAAALIPGARHLHLQRMLAGVHLGAILLSGVALGALAARLRALESHAGAALSGGLALFALGPAVLERVEFARENARMARSAEEGLDDPDLRRIFARIESGPPGRVYAGHERLPRLEAKLAQGVPVHAALVARGIPAIPKLWHPFALAGDLAWFDFDPCREEDADLFAVRWFLYPAGAPAPRFAREVDRGAGLVLYERGEAGGASAGSGWFHLASAPRAIETDRAGAYRAVAAWRASAERAAGAMPLLPLGGERWTPAGPGDRPPRGRIAREEIALSIGALEAEVDLDERGFLVAPIGYHPALAATVDGAPAEVAAVAPGFAAVALDPGTHRVRLFVGRDPLRLALALAGLAAVGALVATARKRAQPL